MPILHKRKTTGAYAWQTADLAEGQLGVNLVDGTLHIRDSVGVIQTVQNKVDTDAAYASAAQGTLAGTATQPADNISTLTNDSGFITGYTVTQGDVTGHQAALSITESQISDLGSYSLATHVHEGTAIDATAITDGYVLTADGAGNAVWEAASGGISDIVGDTTPQLGGNLDVNGQSIVSAAAGNITITPDTTGSIVLDGLSWPQADGTASQVLSTDGAGQLSWVTGGGGGGDVVTDLTPQLGGFLDLNGNYIADATGLIQIGGASASPRHIGLDVQLGTLTANVGDRSYATASESTVIYADEVTSANRYRGNNSIAKIDLNGNNATSAATYSSPTGAFNAVFATNSLGTGAPVVALLNGMISDVEVYDDTSVTTAVGFRTAGYNGGTGTVAEYVGLHVDTGLGATVSKVITCTDANANIDIAGKIKTGAITIPNTDGTPGQMLSTDGAGNLTWGTPAGGMTDLIQDATPQLGGNLDLNSNNISGVGTVSPELDYTTDDAPLKSTITNQWDQFGQDKFLELGRDDASSFGGVAPTWRIRYKGTKAADNWNQSYEWYIEQVMRGWDGPTFYTHTVKPMVVNPGSWNNGDKIFDNGDVQFGVPLNAQKAIASSSFGSPGTVAWQGLISTAGVPTSQLYSEMHDGSTGTDIASDISWNALTSNTAAYNGSKGYWTMTVMMMANAAGINVIRALPVDTYSIIGTTPSWVDTVNREFNLENGKMHKIIYQGIAGKFSIEFSNWTQA